MANKPVLGYWNIRGRAQDICCLLAYLNVDYEEKRYDEEDRAEWLADKPNLGLAFPNLPYWLHGTTKLSESRAIIRHICRTYKPEMIGITPHEQTLVEMIDNFISDFRDRGIVTVCYLYTDKIHKEYKETMEPTKLEYLSNFLKDKPWLTGDEITYVDFVVNEILHQVLAYDDKSLNNFPNLLAYKARFDSLPAIKKYMESPSFLKGPCFSHQAKFPL